MTGKHELDEAFDEGPQTLREAYDVLWHQNPDRTASPDEWLEFHRYCARVYTEVADIDRRHHHEALACVRMERHAAEQIAEHLKAQRSEGS